MKKKDIHPGRIQFLQFLEGQLGYREGHRVWAALRAEYPELLDSSRCPNCDASMEQYRYSFRWHHAMLLIVMARAVRDRMDSGLAFSDANAVHVPTLQTTHAVKCSTTQARLLGLVAKVKNANGTQIGGKWLITARGWAALRGEAVPEHVIAFRNAIEDRTEALITLAGALGTLSQRAAVDPREEGYQAEYHPGDWFGIDGFHEGRLFPVRS